MFKERFKDVLEIFEVSRVFQVKLKGLFSSFNQVSRVFERGLKGVSGKSQ